MQQPDICEDIFSSLNRLLSSFTQLSTAPNTSFSHHGGFQQLAPSQQTLPTEGTSVETMVQWIIVAAFVFFLVLGQGLRDRQPNQDDLKPNRNNQ